MKILAFKINGHRVHDYDEDIVLFKGQYQDAVGIQVNAKRLYKKLGKHLKRKKHAR